MTSVLYSAGLNYQVGNPVRQEIVSIRRDVDSLRKQIDALTEENQVYRKYIVQLLSNGQEDDGKMQAEFTRDLMNLSSATSTASGLSGSSSSSASNRSAGGGTVQGSGFRR